MGGRRTAPGWRSTLAAAAAVLVLAGAGATGLQSAAADTGSSVVSTWGDNTYGQLGNGTTTSSSTPVEVSGITDATAVTAGHGYACALHASGSVSCWGLNGAGTLGNGTYTNSSTPVAVSGITNATAIAGGGNVTCALLATGAVDCWGVMIDANFDYLFSSTVPTAIPGITNATAIGVGDSYACAVLTDGTVRCLGANDHGQLGDGSTTDSSTPVTVSGIATATAVAADQWHTCAVLSGGGVDCWGSNLAGDLGNGTETDSPTPVPVSGIASATAVGEGAYSTCALLAGGSVDCWGSNFYGQLGNGTTTNSSTPVAVSGITDAVAITGSDSLHMCAVLSGGTAECWGWNFYGQLGNGTTTSSSTPVAVSGVTNVTGISAYYYSNVVLTTVAGSRAAQTIRFDPLPDLTLGDSPFTVSATATSGLPVSFSSETQSVCTVSGTTVTLVATGTCTIDADQAGNADYLPALTVPRTFAVVQALPNGASIASASWGTETDGTPAVYWAESFTLAILACRGGTGTAVLSAADGYTQTVPLAEGSPGVYTATFDRPYPHHGRASISWTLSCGTTNGFDLYIDPSGVVEDTHGNPVAGATVTLFRSDTADGPFVQVPDGSTIMSPGNRYNPDTTSATGSYGWDVLAGFYKVRAEKDGCTAPGGGAGYVESGVLTIPPAVTDLTLTLDCTPAASSHTVSFDANGGSGSMAAQSADTATALTSNAFTRSGSTFAGWNTQRDGSGSSYADGAVYPFDADATLYAQWTPVFAGITFVNTVESGAGKAPNCTTKNPFKTGTDDVNSFPHAVCSSDGNAPSPSTFSWEVELANGTPSKATAVTNTGPPITVTVTRVTPHGMNHGKPPILVSGTSATIGHGSSATTTPFTVGNIGGGDWIQVTCTVTVGANSYTLEMQVH
jgi:hypothetical protein